MHHITLGFSKSSALSTALTLLLAWSILLASISNAHAQVTIISNANLYTASHAQPTAQAAAYENGIFVAVGDLESLNSLYPAAKQMDLTGKTVIPGFIDAHGHLLGLGMGLMQADLVGTENKAEIVQRLQAFAADLPTEQWLLGRGWDQNDWPVKKLPTAADLDTAFPTRPVWIERIDGHAGWANSAAMKLVDKDLSGNWQLDGGEILRNKEQQASGVFVDNASSLVQQVVPAPSTEILREALQRAIDKTASVGLTGMHDAGTSKQVWDLLRSIKSSSPAKLRVYAMADGDGEMLAHLCRGGAIIDPQAILTARAVKLYSDGALGSRGAALLEPYTDSPDNSGLLITSAEKLRELAIKAAACGLQVNIHAIGDRGNRLTLDALEEATQDNLDNLGRHRIEHSQVVESSDFARFKQLNLIASVQPTHATSDMYWAEDRVGAERIKGAYAWQEFIKLGIPLALGSDFPVERPAPLLGFHAAVSRQDGKDWPVDGWYSEQRLTRDQALHGFTLGAAYAAFQEDQLGSIEVGKRADFVVLSQDIMTVPAEEILATKIMGTYINGNAVYESSVE